MLRLGRTPKTSTLRHSLKPPIGNEIRSSGAVSLIRGNGTDIYPAPDLGGTLIDFNNSSLVKLKPVDTSAGRTLVEALLLEAEGVELAFQGTRDSIIFTDRRIIAVNIQGYTGKKVDYTSMPYKSIQAFSVETAGGLDRDVELEMWFSGLGKVKLEFATSVDVRALGRHIAGKVFQLT
jgi:hypothetical protein